MAKLPDIQYQRVSPVQGQSPGVAVAESRQRMQLVNQAMEGAEKVSDSYREFNAAEALSGYAEETSAFRREMDKYDTITPAEAKYLSDEYQIDINMEGKKHLRRDEWYPQILEKQLAYSRTKHMSGIRSNIDRKKIDQKLRHQELGVIEQESAAAAAQAQKIEDAAQISAIDTAIKRGELDTAGMLTEVATAYNGYPQLREAKMQEVARASEFSMFDDLLVQGKYDEVMDMAVDTDRATNLSSKELRTTYFAAQQKQDQVETEYRRIRAEQQDLNYADAVAGLYAGTVTQADLQEDKRLYKPSHLNSLFSLSTTLTNSAGDTNSPYNQAVENHLNNLVTLAENGIYPSGMNIDSAAELIRTQIIGSQARFDENGNAVPGLTRTQSAPLLARSFEMKEKAYEVVGYSQLVKDLQYRILRTLDGNAMDDVSASTMANALRSLNGYIDSQQKNGETVDLEGWRKSNINVFLNKVAVDEIYGLPNEVKHLIKFMPDGVTVDVETMLNGLTERMRDLDGQPENQEKLRSGISKLQQWHERNKGE